MRLTQIEASSKLGNPRRVIPIIGIRRGFVGKEEKQERNCREEVVVGGNGNGELGEGDDEDENDERDQIVSRKRAFHHLRLREAMNVYLEKQPLRNRLTCDLTKERESQRQLTSSLSLFVPLRAELCFHYRFNPTTSTKTKNKK